MSMPNQPSATPERPANYADLLSHPINNKAGEPSYDGWELDHANKMRFYVGGMHWFIRASGLVQASALPGFAERAVETIQDHTTWPRMPVSPDSWMSCSDVQFRHARNTRPISLPKALLIIVACELALTERVRLGRAIDATVNGLSVYDKMSIIPACWHIDDFDKDAKVALLREDPEADAKLRDAAGQTKKTFLDHLAVGQTVTLETARAVKRYLDANHPRLGIGAVSARPSNKLGVRHATDFEHLDAG